MIWVALALAIVLLSGDGDGFAVYRDAIHALRDGVRDAVDDPPRRDAALGAVDLLERAVTEHWAALDTAGDCVERADRRYDATLDDYRRCRQRFEAVFSTTAARYVEARSALEVAVPAEAWPALDETLREALE